MAIAVPFILAAAGATATTITLVSIAFAVTGISAKINSAASQVFGKDLVQIANLAGAAYGAYNGGFSVGGGSEAGVDAAAGGGSGAESIAPVVDAAAPVVDATSMVDAASMGPTLDEFNLAQLSGQGSAIEPGLFSEPIAATQISTDGTNLNMLTSQPAASASTTAQTTQPAVGATGATAPSATASATTSQATSAIKAPGIDPQSSVNQYAQGPSATSPNVIDNITNGVGKMFQNKDGSTNYQMVGNLAQGLGSGYTGYASAQQRAKEAADLVAFKKWQMSQNSGVRITG